MAQNAEKRIAAIKTIRDKGIHCNLSLRRSNITAPIASPDI